MTNKYDKLIELLNELIRKWWKPRWKIDMEFMYMLWDKEHPIYTLFFKWWASWVISAIEQHHIRELVSKESWLWQFVWENGYNLYKKNYFHWFSKYGLKWEYWDTSDFEYYVLESALCDEDKLEEFLLENIKVE